MFSVPGGHSDDPDFKKMEMGDENAIHYGSIDDRDANACGLFTGVGSRI
jgi:hypothetical protein